MFRYRNQYDQFCSLPKEIYFALVSYFPIADLISISQTCQEYREIYTPPSWASCSVVTSENYSEMRYDNELLNTRCIPARVFYNPEKFSWFMNDRVVEFWFKTTLESSSKS